MTRGLAVLLLFGLLAPLAAEGAVKSKAITYEHAGTTLEGYLAWPEKAEGKLPGVLVVHEWWGLNEYARERCDMLAEKGYVAFALDMYGKGKLTEHPETAGKWASEIRENQENWLARAKAGLQVLLDQPMVDDSRIAAMGYCFGGSTVLQMAFGGLDLDAVVSFHGALSVPSEERAQAVEASILICHGSEDAFIPEETARKLREALDAADADWQMVYFGNARHSFTVPEADERGIENIKYDADADARSWAYTLFFFDRQLRGEE